MSNRPPKQTSPVTILVFGVMIILAGGSYIAYEINQYHDWKTVKVTYEMGSCDMKFSKPSPTTKKNRTEGIKCDRVSHYNYNNQEYESKDRLYYKHKSIMPDLTLNLRWINPKDPVKSVDPVTELKYAAGVCLVGLITLLVGISGLRKKKSTQTNPK